LAEVCALWALFCCLKLVHWSLIFDGLLHLVQRSSIGWDWGHRPVFAILSALIQPSIHVYQITDRSFGYASARLWNQRPWFISSTSIASLVSIRLLILAVNLFVIITTLDHSFTLSLHAQNLLLQQIFPTLIDFSYLWMPSRIRD